MTYEQMREMLGEEVLERRIYQLQGEDVLSVLSEKGLLERLTPEMITQMIEAMVERFCIEHWDEYVGAYVDDYMESSRKAHYAD